MRTTEQHLDRLWSEYLAAAGESDTNEIDRQAFNLVLDPLVRCLNKIAGGGMFSETACIVAAREVLKLG
jgi:hypothetical protein